MLFEPFPELTQNWEELLFKKMIISFGYGYGALFSNQLLLKLKPSMTEIQTNVLSLICCLLLGSINAFFWLHSVSYANVVIDLRSTFALGFIFSLTGFYFFYNHKQKLKAQRELEIARLQQSEQHRALALSQLKLLQSQIEPHFLFNTLANLDVLIDKDPKMAKHLLVNLTELFRGSLKKNRKDLVHLQEELALIDAYLSIQKIRLGTRLTYRIINDFSTEGFFLPPMLIQPLIENAICHGIEPQYQPGNLDIRILKRNHNACIQVIDNGCGFQEQKQSNTHGHGLGLENVRERLHAIYLGQAQLRLWENECQGVTAEMSIPLHIANMI